jgi:hypothetical protein
LFSTLFNFSTGQIFNFVMISGGLIWLIIASRLPDREPVRIYPLSGDSANADVRREDKKTAAKSRRKLRKKLK